VIDTHNQLRQYLLRLEKKLLTKNSYFHLSTTIIGINVMDAYHLANYHRVINCFGGGSGEKKVNIQRFAGILSHQLIKMQRDGGLQIRDFFQKMQWSGDGTDLHDI
jgi:hypothetical protein